MFVVDESSGMSSEHEWLRNKIQDMEDSLVQAGIGSSTTLPNLYAVVAFGGSLKPRVLTTSMGAKVLVPLIRTSDLLNQLSRFPQADSEDGYLALDVAARDVPLRKMVQTRSIFVLITDEDREVANHQITLDSAVKQLRKVNAELVVIADVIFNRSTGNDLDVMGKSRQSGYSYSLNSAKGFNEIPLAALSVVSGYGNSIQDYVPLANRLQGSIFAINMLRSGAAHSDALVAALLDSLQFQVAETKDRCLECICQQSHARSVSSSSVVSRCLEDLDPQRCQCEASGGEVSHMNMCMYSRHSFSTCSSSMAFSFSTGLLHRP